MPRTWASLCKTRLPWKKAATSRENWVILRPQGAQGVVKELGDQSVGPPQVESRAGLAQLPAHFFIKISREDELGDVASRFFHPEEHIQIIPGQASTFPNWCRFIQKYA